MAPGVLLAAAAAARAQGVTAEVILLGEGEVSEYHYYRSLARHLRLAFLDGPARLGPATRYPQSILAGAAPLADGFLLAPRGRAISPLIDAVRRSRSATRNIVLTTPTHLLRLVQAAARRDISRSASLGLWSFDQALCAKNGASQCQRYVGLAVAMSVALSALLVPAVTGTICGMALSLAFLAAIWLRLAACFASARPAPMPPPIRQSELPIYSIVIALYREVRTVPQLVAALNRLDYPRAKLDVKLVIEEDDKETLGALIRAGRLPYCELIVAPAGGPRTKPRALNVALPLLRGRLVAIFDAEDLPDRQEIRAAAERFARAPERLACLQAHLAIDNVDDSWLTRGMLAQTPEDFQLAHA